MPGEDSRAPGSLGDLSDALRLDDTAQGSEQNAGQRLLAEHAIVESQIFTRRQVVTLARQPYGSSVQMIVVPPVLKLLSNSTTKLSRL
jgi:hypothetical protein